MGTRAVVQRALRGQGSGAAPSALQNKRKSAPERIPGGYASPFKLLFSRGSAAPGAPTASYMPTSSVVPGAGQLQPLQPKQVRRRLAAPEPRAAPAPAPPSPPHPRWPP
jgi:hypothetical protein